MRIECTTTFLHGRERFEKGDIFTVPDADAAYFIGNKDDDEELEPAVIEAVAVVPAPRRMVTLEKLIGKKAAAQVNEAQLSSAIRMLKRKRQDEELMLM